MYNVQCQCTIINNILFVAFINVVTIQYILYYRYINEFNFTSILFKYSIWFRIPFIYFI